jgi:mannose-6-phosphate isomerase-like protein (cupin superfamily)
MTASTSSGLQPAVARPGGDVTRRIEGDIRPAWSDVTSTGTFRVPADGRFDRHHHDCDEYWFIVEGRAIVEIDAERYRVQPGDIVCTQRGREHDILQLFDDELVGFWFETALVPGGSAGHLHRSPEAAAGHPILGPAEPLAPR